MRAQTINSCCLYTPAMTSLIRRAISQQLPQLKHIYQALEVPPKKQNAAHTPILQWILPASIAQQQQHELLKTVKTLKFDDTYVQEVRIVPGVGHNSTKVEFQLQPDAFVAQLLQAAAPVAAATRTEHIVVEYSSPNIAKPFHVGHLRSTIIGNVLANLHQHLGYRTTRLNYLGDWGTQFGLLALGVQMANVSDAEMRAAPIKSLYNAYVLANKAAATNKAVSQNARDIFAALEAGENTAMASQWQQYRHYTIEELTQVYARLGVHFDSYEWESQYSQRQIGKVLTQLRAAGLLQREQDGREIIVVDERRVPVIKSDGATLYLARDIAALLDRQVRLQFSRILYVVDNSQTDHFKAVFQTASALDKQLSLHKLQHVKFGRIHGMSTRQGKAVFLQDVLDEARDIMREKRSGSATTKENDSMTDDEVCDVLGVSAVLVNVLKQRRQRDHEFNWQLALQVNGDTGIKLQYTHCRLHSLLHNFSHVPLTDIKPSWQQYAQQAEALDLLYELARYEQCVWQAQQQLEACILVNYLFALCNAASRALKRLPVKQENCAEKQAQRLLLFQAVKRTLKQGMQLLGLKPLNQM